MLHQDGMAFLLGKRRAIDDQGLHSCISKRGEHGKRFELQNLSRSSWKRVLPAATKWVCSTTLQVTLRRDPSRGRCWK